MANSTIANLPSGSPAQPSDQLPIQRGSSTLKILVSDILALVTAGVSSVFGRTGAVTAQTGDYSQSQISSGAIANGSTATTQTALDASTKLATTSYVDSAVAAGVGEVQSVAVTLTASQVTASSSGSNPVQIIPDPGSGKIIVPIFVLWEYVHGTSSFGASGTSLELIWGTSNATFDPGVSDDFLTAGSSQVMSQCSGGSGTAMASSQPSTALAHQAVNFVNAGSAATGGGTSTVKVFVSYRIVTL